MPFIGKVIEDLNKFDEILKSNPKDGSTWVNKGISLYCLKRYEEAIKAYENALRLSPKFKEAWYN
ncbi:MAG: tetratricopeptide repeat protein, partial [Thermodesulfobacteriota bacterium]